VAFLRLLKPPGARNFVAKRKVFVNAGPFTEWGSLASNGRALHHLLDGLRDLQQARDDRPARDAYEPTGGDIARKVVAKVNA